MKEKGVDIDQIIERRIPSDQIIANVKKPTVSDINPFDNMKQRKNTNYYILLLNGVLSRDVLQNFEAACQELTKMSSKKLR